MHLKIEFHQYISSFGHYLVELLTQVVHLKKFFEYGISSILQPF